MCFNPSHRDKYCMRPLLGGPWSSQTHRQTVDAGSPAREGVGDSVFNGAESQFCNMKRAMERNGGDDCTKVCLIPPNDALKVAKMVHFMFCVYHSKKKMEKKTPTAFRGSTVLT